MVSVNLVKAGVELVKSFPLANVANFAGLKSIVGTVLNPSGVFGNGTTGKGLEWLIAGGLAAKGTLDTLDHAQRGTEVLQNPASRETVSQHKEFGTRYLLGGAGLAILSGLLPGGKQAMFLKEIARAGSLLMTGSTAVQSRVLNAAQGVNSKDPLLKMTILGHPLFYSGTPTGEHIQNPFIFNLLCGKKFAEKDREFISEEAQNLNGSQRHLETYGDGENPLKFLFSSKKHDSQAHGLEKSHPESNELDKHA